ncbi:MAG: tyrosine-type recombinase/integrase [Dysgonamonadaceae bacterium]|jgi:integrase/recombinase XerC|nr:tyrosine-type recombinase/integrase [Dysgonamonadaceae bacterium]MDD3355918.1 tyrosine-type recombinase/integrase [Dysgonamonadaceae bacterium]MDD3727003.1 tyrosine-type recombinase/integrase [Dysgonamonadaceae bacterium]MDD4245870.1 tyrosine-type recombinase/integrase [Dysgonamonadaceae bacterium]MDD4605092.1 tyrosine-type recombinase/integrase [Dysgonamonadaceae bacterium]
MLKDKFIRYLRYEKNCSSHTEISYLNDLNQFQEFIESETGEFNPKTIDTDLIRMWIAQLIERGFKASTANRKLSTLKSFYTFLQKKQLTNTNPAAYITGPRMDKKLPSFVKHSDMIEVLNPDSFSDNFEGKRNLFLLKLLYLTGMRREELIGLKDEDIDFFSNTLRIHGKGNKDRIVPFSDQTKELFCEYLSIRNEEIENRTPYLFVRKNGKRMYPAMVYTIVNRHLSNVKTLSTKSPHVLRHSFATVMLNNGAEINAIKNLLGHVSLASTQIYTHVTFKELKEVYDNAHPRA